MSLLVSTERPSVPEWIEREVVKLGGKTSCGKPTYRLMWGASKVAHALDITSDYDAERWHLEKWVEGHYQHAYKFGYCPHMKKDDKNWCKACTLSGGESFSLESHFRIIERVVRMFVLTEQMQKSSVDKGAKMERDALMEREQAREREAQKAFSDSLMGNLSAIDRVPHSISPRGSKTLREVDMPLHAGQVTSPDGKKRLQDGGTFQQI